MSAQASFDIVIRNGRVMDPETGRDEIADVGIKGDKIAAIGQSLAAGAKEMDAEGKIVCPGFVDIHAHGQSIPADRMQAFDGVTTSLELEIGALPVADWYSGQAKTGRVLNYGCASAWIIARMAAMTEFPLDAGIKPLEAMGYGAKDTRWSTEAATNEQAQEIVRLVKEGLDAGAIGVGIPNGYAKGAGLKELTWICDAAKSVESPTFTHVAFASNIDPQSGVEAYVRIIGLAGATGCDMHICHLNSTSLQDVEHAITVLRKAQEQGLPVTVEAYPYGTGSTVASAGFLRAPDFREKSGGDYKDIELVRNRRRMESREDVLAVGDENPSELILWHFLDVANNERHQELLDMSVVYPGGAIGSDAMPWIKPDGSLYEGTEWPLPSDVSAHPRSSACFVKFMRDYVRDRKLVPLMEGIAKCTTIPSAVIEKCTPQMRTKARLQEGMDADILIFDLDALDDKADFSNMTQVSEGVIHLIVNGVPVIEKATLAEEALPGRAIRR